MKFNNNYSVGKNVKIGKNSLIGDRTVIYDNVVIGNNTIISNDCIIGEPTNEYYRNNKYKNPKTVIGAGSLIRSHTIIYADSSFGEHFQTGHRVTIREKTKMGAHCSIGTLSDIQGYVTAGDYCRLHSNVHICQHSKLGNFIYVYPYAIFTNDPTPPSNMCVAPKIGDYSVIATGAMLMPGVTIGKNCVIGAGAIVTKNVEDFSLMLGMPAKRYSDVREIDSREHKGKKHYPWMFNFDRDKPWEHKNFKTWLKKNGKKFSLS